MDGYLAFDYRNQINDKLILPTFNEAALSGLDIAKMAKTVDDQIELREKLALCPADLSEFKTTASHSQFMQESDMQVVVTTCMLAANEKRMLLTK